ncbi:MAG: hypothetical protein JO250_21540 [Armatimonadetes bacterium]|nr:hypothetical protein [Armatimonadota bacterium]
MKITKDWSAVRVLERVGGWTTVFLFLGAIFTFFGAWSAARDQTRDANTLKAKSDQLASKNEELARKSDEIARLAKINADMATGGDSFCFLRLTPSKQGYGYLTVEHWGNYPVYDATADVVDLSGGNVARDPKHPEQISGNRYKFKVGNVVSGLVPDEIGKFPLPEKGDIQYVVLIKARNGMVNEEIKGTRLENGEWHIRTTVSRTDPVTHQSIAIYRDPPA